MNGTSRVMVLLTGACLLAVVVVSCGDGASNGGDTASDGVVESGSDAESSRDGDTEVTEGCPLEDNFHVHEGECRSCSDLMTEYRSRVTERLTEEDSLSCERTMDCVDAHRFSGGCSRLFGCPDDLVNRATRDAWLEANALVAAEMCPEESASWYGCDEETMPISCEDREAFCYQGECLDLMVSMPPHVGERSSDPGETGRALPLIAGSPDCAPRPTRTLGLCEWLSTMDGLLIGAGTQFLDRLQD